MGQDKPLLIGKAMAVCVDSILVPLGNLLAMVTKLGPAVFNLDQTLSS